ncbi:MAG TPA: SpoIIE family protein phosphatase [Pyrinomonadaceae bacterium]|nr:SpoIIE family protein phosphatase [Pyrinomonadaceae bacterium]
MRVLPRIGKPTLKPFRHGWRRLKRSLTVPRVVVAAEIMLFAFVWVFVFSGSRRAALDSWGQRSDLVVTLLLAIGMVALHHALKKYFVPRIERYFSPVAYEERQVLFSLGQEARAASNIRELYAAIANRIATSFEADNVSILIRDEITGDYSLAASSDSSLAVLLANPETNLTLSRKAFTVKRVANLSTPLVIESDEFQIWERAFDAGSPAAKSTRTQERDVLKQLKAHLLVQVRTKDQMMGILSLGLRRGHFRYSQSDREVLTSIAGQLALVIENAQLAERMVVQEKLNRELALAVEVQRRLLPKHLPETSGLELAGFCEPARGVGGDYYDFITHEDQQVGIAIADVSGKGLPAALLMSTVQATLRSLAARVGGVGKGSRGLAETVSTLNRLLCDSTGGANYVTFFYAQFDPDTKALAYVNAGHNPPLYLRADSINDFTSLSCGGLIVGIFKDCIYEQAIVETQPGDILFAYTDGLTESMNREGEEFGEIRLRETLAAHAGRTVHEIRDELLRRVKQWSFGAPQYDDLTFVIMKVPLGIGAVPVERS